jgi:hypothetical protein
VIDVCGKVQIFRTRTETAASRVEARLSGFVEICCDGTNKKNWRSDLSLEMRKRKVQSSQCRSSGTLGFFRILG